MNKKISHARSLPRQSLSEAGLPAVARRRSGPAHRSQAKVGQAQSKLVKASQAVLGEKKIVYFSDPGAFEKILWPCGIRLKKPNEKFKPI
jgi:hypothetical protein